MKAKTTKAAKPKIVKKLKVNVCPACGGRGLKDANTLCSPCEGSGQVK